MMRFSRLSDNVQMCTHNKRKSQPDAHRTAQLLSKCELYLLLLTIREAEFMGLKPFPVYI